MKKLGLKLSIQKTKIMASGPITSWEIDGETVETGSDFNFLGSKITADGDCSREIKNKTKQNKTLFLGKKAMTNLDSIKAETKREKEMFAVLTKVYLFKAMVFPIVMWKLDHKES